MDPGTAIGVASLGIQVCQGLIQYYQDWDGYPDDIQQLRSSATALERILSAVKKAIEFNAAPKDSLAEAEACLMACGTAVGKLEVKLRKFPVRSQAGFKDLVKEVKARSLYPFKKHVLEKLNALVEGLILQLGLAVQALQVELGRDTLVAIDRVEGTLGDVVDGVKRLNLASGKIQHTTENVQRGVEDVANGVKRVDLTTGKIQHITESTAVVVEDLLAKKVRQEVVSWLAAPDPASNHEDAREKHEEGTGGWFLDSQAYQEWLGGNGSHLWLHGKAGCCKTISCSTVIADVTARVAGKPDCAVAFFYFSFRDEAKQNYNGLLRSLVKQLSWGKPILSELEAAYEKGEKKSAKMEEIFLLLVQRAGTVYILIDALDEVPDDDDERHAVMEGLKQLTDRTHEVKLLVTSRRETDIKDFMSNWRIRAVPVEDADVNSDIKLYVSRELERHHRLRSLPQQTKDEILSTFARKADGMFRWAFCQLRELQRLKILRPRYVSEVLKTLPETLDETYLRMLASIEWRYQEEVKIALTWLCFSLEPLDRGQLIEACITDPDETPAVDEDSRDAMGDIFQLLGPLVQFGQVSGRPFQDQGYVSLAHFTVKEYLVSTRTKGSPAGFFYLDEGLAHKNIAETCLAYLCYYWIGKKTSVEEFGNNARLGRYILQGSSEPLKNGPSGWVRSAASLWVRHQIRAEELLGCEACDGLVWRFLDDNVMKAHWYAAKHGLDPSSIWWKDNLGGPLYWAFKFGLPATTELLLTRACPCENEAKAREDEWFVRQKAAEVWSSGKD